MCFIIAVYRYSPRLPDAPGRAGRGAAGGRPPRAAGRGGSAPGSSRRPGPWWRRARDASATRRGRPRKDRSPAVDRPRDVPVAQGSRFEITWRAVGRLASRSSASNLRHPSARTCAAPSTCPARGTPTSGPRSPGRPRGRGARACPRCARPPRASAACPWTAPARAPSSRRARRRGSRPPRPRPTARRSETLRPRHGAAQAPRHEGRRVLRDPDLGGEPGGGHAPLGLASSHMARDRRRRCASGCRVAVPAVTERWRGHLARRRVRLRPATGEHVAHPHLSHSHPSGHLTPRQPPLAAPSPGYLAGRARGLPILPISPRPACASCCPSCPLPRPLFLGTMMRHGRRCVTCDYEAHWGAFQDKLSW